MSRDRSPRRSIELETSRDETGLAELMRNHVTSLEALRDVADLASAVDDERGDRVRQIVEALPQFGDEEKRRSLIGAMRQVAGLFEALASQMIREDVAASTTEEAEFRPAPIPGVDLSVARDAAGQITGGSIAFADPEIEAYFWSFLNDLGYYLMAPPRRAVLMTSLLTTVVGTFDALYQELASTYFRLHPGALGDKPEFSLSDLAAFDTVEEARIELIRRRVSAMDQGLEEQAKWLRSRLDIDLRRLAIDWDRLTEIVQRRHTVVHAGGRATQRYKAKIPERFQVPVGDQLPVDRAYLDVAIDELMALGVGLVLEVWVKLLKDEQEEAASSLHAAARRSARASRWHVVRRLTTIPRRAKLSQRMRIEFNVLGWLADKNLDGRPPSEVESWDVTALATRWTLAKLCLLGETDTAASILPKVVESGELTAVAVMTEPLYEELRAKAPVRELLRDSGLADPERSADKDGADDVASRRSDVGSNATRGAGPQ